VFVEDHQPKIGLRADVISGRRIVGIDLKLAIAPDQYHVIGIAVFF